MLGKSVPLFEESSGLVHTFQYGNNRRTLLKRSESMETLVSNEVKKLTDDFEAGTNLYEGIIYMMFWKDGGLTISNYGVGASAQRKIP